MFESKLQVNLKQTLFHTTTTNLPHKSKTKTESIHGLLSQVLTITSGMPGNGSWEQNDWQTEISGFSFTSLAVQLLTTSFGSNVHVNVSFANGGSL